MIHSEAKRGFFVNTDSLRPLSDSFSAPTKADNAVDPSLMFKHAESILRMKGNIGCSFLCGSPTRDFLPEKAVIKTAASLVHLVNQPAPFGGDPELKRIIAESISTLKLTFQPDDIVLTNGATEALQLALKATTQPGDTVLLEDPTYFEFFRVLSYQGLQAVQVPCHSHSGVQLDALEAAMKKHSPKAFVVQPTIQNPTGAIIPIQNRAEIVRLALKYNVAVIEDNTLAVSLFSSQAFPSLQEFDSKGFVYSISSFSKIVGQGLRVGWIAHKNKGNELLSLKMALNLNNSSFPETIIGHLLKSRKYQQHKHVLRKKMFEQSQQMGERIQAIFKEDAEFFYPHGGYTLWIALPKISSAELLYLRCLKRGISFAPGSIFSKNPAFKNYFRLSFSGVLDSTANQALLTIKEEYDKIKRF